MPPNHMGCPPLTKYSRNDQLLRVDRLQASQPFVAANHVSDFKLTDRVDGDFDPPAVGVPPGSTNEVNGASSTLS